MTNHAYYAIHYMRNGEPEHFITTATEFSEEEAIRLAASHAGQGSDGRIDCCLSRDAMLLEAGKLGVTQVRWNKAG
ncbi:MULTISPECIES: DUF6555 family protein [unclassified Pseudomonas]|jgi:hypothetical protein|uniref:Uncharacterized protein n=1 Tax=Pseudomonas gorinensis TaxID=3240790 RepID=A0ACA7P6F1_9PSED|nr:hypothetical protein U771_15120 [Pseudomonas sp. TKP]PMX15293.1 hypothetical protein C1Y25_12170 [Pseudomonas sp. MPBC4-3]PMX47247.1 hypothetical protein C1Y20_14290 [Pseudomonas sp. FW301-21B01]PMY07968.1 hypothetical protein C1Y18_11605 [Pseudomonas sp. MPR-R5A]PNA62830.1 hypothetical protein C1Y14_27650 [Pseudomonas sp. MPR-R5B]